MSATTDRDRAIETARKDFQAAYLQARRVAEPWFRCQALASVARNADGKKFYGIVMEAVKAASEADDPYERIAVLAWPIRAMIERD